MKSKLLLITGLLLILSCTEINKKEQLVENNIEEDSIDRILQKARFGKELIETFVPYVSPSVVSNGKTHFSYELQIANTYRLLMELVKIEVYEISIRQVPIMVFDSTYISKNIQRPGLPKGQNEKLFEGGQFGIVNLWISILKNEEPENIFHKLHFNVQAG
jgi:hypothetical protein